MPIYGYACKNCDHSFDVLQKMSEPRLLECPKCGEASLQKQLSAPKFRLKGAGWYETDFKTGDKRNIAGETNAKPDAKTAETTETPAKPDAKPEAKAAAKTESTTKPDTKVSST